MNSTLNMLVLRPSGTIALWSLDDVDNGWALSSDEARQLADGCDAAVAAGLRLVKIGERDTGDVYFEGATEVIAKIGANLRTMADRSDSVRATKQ